MPAIARWSLLDSLDANDQARRTFAAADELTNCSLAIRTSVRLLRACLANEDCENTEQLSPIDREGLLAAIALAGEQVCMTAACLARECDALKREHQLDVEKKALEMLEEAVQDVAVGPVH